ncbi:MAG TPA: hypothetical protein VNZ66_11445 [Aeromicrobium sp.]|nr:hypothetical protein [Aeromicrobium sp.]
MGKDEFTDVVAEAIARLDPQLQRRLDEEDAQAHLDLVVLTNRAHVEVGELLRSAVSAARAAGWSWEAIGGSLQMSRQAAQQRFGRMTEEDEFADEEQNRRLVGLTAFNEIETLNDWGRHGWHSVACGPMFHDVVHTGMQWEHKRVVVGGRAAKTLESQGWERISTVWFPWVYFRRSLGIPALPGEPE